MNRYDMKFDTEVYGRDKKIGRLQKLIIHPRENVVTHFVVVDGAFFKRSFVIPLTALEASLPDKLQLSLYQDEVMRFPQFKEIEESTPERAEAYAMDAAFGSEGYGATLLLDEETTLEGQDGRLGQLSHVIVQATDGRIRQLVMSQGKLVPHYVCVPVAAVDRWGESSIQIKADTASVEAFSDYVMRVEESEPAEAAATQATPLTDNLTSDLTAVLADDPRTETAVIEIINERGVVTLSGTVTDRQTKDRAETLVRLHPAVISVNNSLQVAPR